MIIVTRVFIRLLRQSFFIGLKAPWYYAVGQHHPASPDSSGWGSQDRMQISRQLTTTTTTTTSLQDAINHHQSSNWRGLKSMPVFCSQRNPPPTLIKSKFYLCFAFQSRGTVWCLSDSNSSQKRNGPRKARSPRQTYLGFQQLCNSFLQTSGCAISLEKKY